MNTHIFDGRKFAKGKEALLLKKVQQLRKHRVTPKLVAILVGDDLVSRIYVGLKKKAAERIGIELQLIELKQASVQQLLHLIKELNQDRSVHGIMVQLPLPGRLNKSETQNRILNSIAPEKDVDGLRQDSLYVPAVVKAVLYSIKVAQKEGCLPDDLKKVTACVVGARGMVGMGVVGAMRGLGINVVKTDVKTRNLKTKTKEAEIIISATGVPGLIQGDMVKPGAVVIDVGAPKGDVDFESVKDVASFITPVPGGIGPVTVVSLMENVVKAAAEK